MASLAPPRNGRNDSIGSSSNGSTNGQSSKDLFNAALQSRVPTNNYITHLKIWETVNEGSGQTAPPANAQRKARYLILAVQRDTGRVTMNKAKRNANGTFSIGKDWDLNTLREIIVHEPTYFTLTLSRSYSWQTERPKEQSLFLQAAVKIFRKYTGEDGPACVGFDATGANASVESLSAPTPSSTVARSSSPKSSSRGGSIAIDTQIPHGVSRDSVSSAGSRRGNQDGFYSSRDVPSPIRTAPITALGQQASSRNGSFEDVNRRPPTVQRTASSGQRLPAPEIQVQDVSQPLAQHDYRNSQGSSPLTVGSDLPAPSRPPPLLARSPSRPTGSRTASPLVPEATHEVTNQSETSLSQADTIVASTDVSTRRPSRSRGYSVESLGGASSGGDARARLSSIEPVRGGAAYEKMLLAGTGLTGVAEGDDEEEEEDDKDAYGGADIADVTGFEEQDDILPRTARKTPTKKRQGRINSQDLRDAGEVGNVSSDLIDDDEEDTTLAAVEEMLEGFEWRHHHTSNGLSSNRGDSSVRYGSRGGKGPADVIEARLLDELAALDAANIHAIIESDDRVSLVVRHMEEALHQLDVIDSMVASYKMQLNSRANDISHIESQNRGLQVQTSNQRALSIEIDKLLDTVQVDDTAVEALLEYEFASDDGISEVERAGAALYKAMLQARRSEDETRGGDNINATGMAAATERLEEYSNLADQFAMRLFNFLSQSFNAQTKAVLKDPARLSALSPPHPTIESHQAVEDFLGRYCGLLLYAKEVSPNFFQRISASYFTSSSERYKSEIITLFSVWRSLIAPVNDEEISEASFQVSGYAGSASVAARSGTIRRTGRHGGTKSSKGSGEITGYEAFNQILTTIIPLVAREQNFIADLLHINNNNVTFADYMSMEVYFRRRAAEVFSHNSPAGPLRDMKSALDLIFGFFSPEIQTFADQVFAKDRVQLVGVLAALDRSLTEAEELNNEFLSRTLGKLHMRLASQLDKFINEQIRAIEQTKLTVKKRKGVTHFIKVFPNFVERVEVQLINCETLNIRSAIDSYYEAICNTMFDALQAMAIPKVDGGIGNYNADEDKGLLNHHIILIENMYHFVKEVGRLKGSITLGPLMKRAQNMLEDALSSYVQSALRRPLGKMMDFGDGIDALLRSTPPNEVSLHSAYNRQAAKRLVKDYSSKDLRKSIEALSKRVTKHFDEEEITSLHEGLNGVSKLHDASGISAEEIVEVLGKVWRSLEDGFTMECDRLQRILRDCYSISNDSNKLVCDFTIEDVRRPFAGNSPAGKRR